MTFYYVGDDGQPQSRIVPDVLDQVAQVFADVEVEVLRAAGVPQVTFRDFDEVPLRDEPMEQCLSCQCPMDPTYIDEHGICGDCNHRTILDALHTPPSARTDEDRELLRELGYVEEDEYVD